MLDLMVPIVLLTSGLASGVLVGTQLGGWPLLVHLPPAQYVRAHAFFATRYDPFMPACLVASVVGSAVLVVVAPAPLARVLYGLAALLTVCAVLISLRKNVPVNRWIRTLDPDRLPADFARTDPRPHWGSWNRARTVLSACALLLQCAALPSLL